MKRRPLASGAQRDKGKQLQSLMSVSVLRVECEPVVCFVPMAIFEP